MPQQICAHVNAHCMKVFNVGACLASYSYPPGPAWMAQVSSGFLVVAKGWLGWLGTEFHWLGQAVASKTFRPNITRIWGGATDNHAIIYQWSWVSKHMYIYLLIYLYTKIGSTWKLEEFTVVVVVGVDDTNVVEDEAVWPGRSWVLLDGWRCPNVRGNGCAQPAAARQAWRGGAAARCSATARRTCDHDMPLLTPNVTTWQSRLARSQVKTTLGIHFSILGRSRPKSKSPQLLAHLTIDK